MRSNKKVLTQAIKAGAVIHDPMQN